MQTIQTEKPKPKGIKTLIAVGFVIVFVIGISIGANGEKKAEVKEVIKEAGKECPKTEVKEIIKEVEKVAEPIREFSGIGQEATELFSLEKGLHVFEMKHSGSGHFGVRLLDSDGNYIELLANDVGNFDGSKAAKVERDGNYILDISASGNWSIVIK